MTRFLSHFAAVAAVAAIALHASAFAQDSTVTIKTFMFTPMSVSVTAGSTVTWKNADEEPHTVTSETGLFRSGGLDTDQTFSFKFDKPGVYKYSCSIHPQMIGTITVK